MRRRSPSYPAGLCLLALLITQFGVNGFTPLVARAPLVATRQHRQSIHFPQLIRHVAASDSPEDADPVASLEALDALVPRSKITPLIKSKSNVQGALQLAWHMSLFCLAASAIPQPTLSMLGMAFVSAFFFNGLHETVHRTAFASKRLNDAFAQFFGILCVRPAQHYFHYHWQHHKYTGNKQLDSELQEGSFLDIPVETPMGYLIYLTGIPFWMDAWSSLVRHAAGNCPEIYLQSDKARQQVITEARIYLLLYTGLAVWTASSKPISKSVLHFWILPALLGQPFLRFYLLAEHRGRKDSHLIYENTRTMNTNWFYRKLAWNMPYHMEHHAWPSVPFYKLRNAHELLVNATANDESLLYQGEMIDPFIGKSGYMRFHFTFLKNLFQKSKKGVATTTR